jgi:endonuclease/exonuclease/phosphatase family metal-dependent hydrolase
MNDNGLSLNILTINVHKGFTVFNRRFMLHELREAVRDTAADVVFLQEVVGVNSKKASRLDDWPEVSQYEFLADSIWSEYSYGRNAVYPWGDHGNAVLSKFPIRRYQNRDISASPKDRRGLLHCVLECPVGGVKREVHVICVHLGLKEAYRQRQLLLLCRLIEEEVPPNEPLIIAGDFNDWRLRADSILRRCAGLREVFADTCGREARTFPARWPLLRLDRVYVRDVHIDHARALSKRPWSHLSDHAPLMVELRV